MKEALASAAQQPLQVAARLTAAVTHQAEEGGRRLGNKDAASADPCELYHKCSLQMREHEQHIRASAAPGVQAEVQDQASDGALAAAGDSAGEGIAGASAASTSCQEVGNSEQEDSHDLAGLGKASKMFAFLKEDAASSAPDMSNMRAAQKIGAGPWSGQADPRASDYGIHSPLPPATLPDSESHNTTASSSVSSPPIINIWPYAGKGNAYKQDLTELIAVWQSDGPDISGSGIHTYKNYRVDKDVILRVEYISPKETKACPSQFSGFHLQTPSTHSICKTKLHWYPKYGIVITQCCAQGVLLFLWIAETVGLAMLTQEFVLKMRDVRLSLLHL